MADVPRELDWVKARAECTTERLFAALIEQIKSDTDKAEARREQRDQRFRVVEQMNEPVLVIRDHLAPGSLEGEAVAFGLDRNGEIQVVQRSHRSAGRPLLTVRPAVGTDGRCLAEVNGQLLEIWQVSQLALQDLFFKFGLSPTPRSDQ